MKSDVLKEVESAFSGIPEVKGIMIFNVMGKIKHSTLSVPLQDAEDVGRSIVILWDALKKSGVKSGTVNWIYLEGMIFLKDFNGGFLVALTSKKIAVSDIIKFFDSSSLILKDAFSDETEKNILDTIEEKKSKKFASEQLLSESGLNEIVSDIKDSASKIAGAWIEYYFDDLVQEWIDMTQPRKSHLKNLVKAVSEYIDEGNKRKDFIQKATKILGE
ncbi:hypothetical protein JW890_09120 [candidate division WOR-3 bacterium]|nr:hypothetical protein [candidate division WOR-3 bacterium]